MWTQSPDYCSVITNILLVTYIIVCGVSCHTVLLEEERKKERKRERKKKRTNEGKNEREKKGRKEGKRNKKECKEENADIL